MRPLLRAVLPLALLLACDDASTPEPTPPPPTGRPAPVDAAPTLAEAPPIAASPTPPEDAIADDPAPAAQVANDAAMKGGAPLPERPHDQDPNCAAAAKLFTDGDAAMRTGDTLTGRKIFVELIKHYPICPEVPHVYLAFGEYYFERAQLPEAKQFYEKTAQFPEPALVAYAHYKIAWCDLNAGDATAALQSFTRALQVTQNDPDTHARLRDAALRDSVQAYAEVGQPTKAAPFYRHIAGEAGMRAAIDRLAKVYLDRGDREKARVLCESNPGVCQ